MTWLSTFYLRAFVVLLQITCVLSSDKYGPLPGFKQQPIDTLIESNRNQSIFCNIRGENPIVSWIKDQKILDSEKQNYLSISKEGSLTLHHTQRARDEGDYRCVVGNTYGRVFSRRARVTFPYMNEFSAQNLRIEIEEGQPALLSCFAPDSYPDRNIFWMKQSKVQKLVPLQVDLNSHFSTSSNGDLYFSYTTRSDGGVYYCYVENSNLRRLERRVVNLIVTPKSQTSNLPPKIWEFSDQITMKDSNFLLECIAYGRPIPVMRFRNIATGIELNGSKQIGNRLRYEFGRFTSEFEGEYQCEAVNAYGQKATKSAYIKMDSKPEMLFKSQQISKAIDSFLTLPCIAHGIPRVSYSWFLNANSLGSGNEEIKIHKGNLTISKLMKHHQGFYQCLAQNIHGEDLMTVYVTVVEFPPDFGAHSIPPATSTQALIGGTAEIHCKAFGAPTPTSRWRKLNSTLDVNLNERFSVNDVTGTLKILNVKKSDEGMYQCIASNKLGSAQRTGQLRVAGGLAIIEPLSKVDTVRVGSKITLKCVYSSAEKIETRFYWYFGLRPFSRRRLPPRIKITDNKAKKQSLLIISDARFEDTGLYKCEVKGTKSRTAFQMQRISVSDSDGGPDIPVRPPAVKTTTIPNFTRRVIRGPPDPPSHVTATDLSGINIKISWSMGRDNGDKPKKVYIQARTLFDLDVWHTVKVSNKTDGYRSSEIVEMSPWIEFRVRVISENKYGKSKPSDETKKWIRTPTAMPKKYPQNIQGKGTGPSELTVSFDPLPDIDQNAPGIGYIVHYREQGSYYKPIQREVPKDQHFIKLNFINMDSFYKAYEFQVQAKNANGLGPLSPINIAYTGERAPLAAPLNLKVKMDDELNALASWDEVEKSRTSMRGKFQGYKFIYWEQPKENYARIEDYKTTLSSTISVRMEPHTTYYFQVLAYNGAGDGPRSNEFGPVVTPEGIPTKPTNFKIADASIDEVTLTWTEPLQKNGVITKYILTYVSLETDKMRKVELSPDKRMHIVKKLNSHEAYLFKLIAVTKAGSSEEAQVTFDLTKVPTTTLEAPLVKSVGYNAVVLTWLAAPTTEVTGYKLFYRREDENEEKVRGLWEQFNDIVTTVHSLSSGTNYYFQIAVVNKYGTGPRSPVTKATTKYKESNPDAKHASSSIKLKLSNYVLLIFVLTALLVPR